jgi:hypothetical protein
VKSVRRRQSLHPRVFVHGLFGGKSGPSRQASGVLAPLVAFELIGPPTTGAHRALFRLHTKPGTFAIPQTQCACSPAGVLRGHHLCRSTYAAFSNGPNLKYEDQVQYHSRLSSPRPRAEALGRTFVIFRSSCSLTGWLTHPSSGRAFGTPLK